ncbi:dynein axonemal heavy chain 17 [Rhynochetos jubatus]
MGPGRSEGQIGPGGRGRDGRARGGPAALKRFLRQPEAPKPSPGGQLLPTPPVIAPLLLRAENVAGWPGVAAEDAARQIQRLRNETLAASAELQGKPLLPLPESLDGPGGSRAGPQRPAGPADVSVLQENEPVVGEWGRRVRAILGEDSAQPLLGGLHPLPAAEIDFWRTRTLKLQYVSEQLLSPRVSALARMLEQAESSYWPVLQSVLRDVSAGLEEAQDVSLHLQPLRVLLEEMERADYSRLPPYVDRVLCAVRLLRSCCQRYRSPVRVAVILQEICNLLLEMTRQFLSPKAVMEGLRGETEETLEALRLSIATMESLSQSYGTYCSDRLPALFPEQPQRWELCRSLIFRRADSFLRRLRTIEVTVRRLGARHRARGAPPALGMLGWSQRRGTLCGRGALAWARSGGEVGAWQRHRPHRTPVSRRAGAAGRMLRGSGELLGSGAGGAGLTHPGEPGARAVCARQELYRTAAQFLRLEKTELGGVRGNSLGSRVFQLCEEVRELVRGFADGKYDPLDPAEEQLDKDFAAFREWMGDVDRRLATVLRLGFDGCNCPASAVKLVHMFSPVLERPLIRAELSRCYSALLELFKVELEEVKALYDAQTAAPPSRPGGPAIGKNMPPVAGRLGWALELQRRLEGSHGDLLAIGYLATASAEAELVSGKYREVTELLRGYRQQVYEEWARGAARDCHLSLERPLILRDPGSSLLSVNFSRELVVVLREVKYLSFQQQEIPGSARRLFAQQETFQQLVANLDLIVGSYNEVKQRLLPVELPLVSGELRAVDGRLARAERSLCWHHEGVLEYVQEMRGILADLQARVRRARLNTDGICRLMEVASQRSSPVCHPQECSAAPLFRRKESRDAALLDLDGTGSPLSKGCAAVRDAGGKIQAMVEVRRIPGCFRRRRLNEERVRGSRGRRGERGPRARARSCRPPRRGSGKDRRPRHPDSEHLLPPRGAENAALLRADRSSREWQDYVGYIDGIVLDGLSRLLHRSLQLLLTNMAPHAAVAPLFEVRLELRDGRAQYRPSLEVGEEGSLLELVETLLGSAFASAGCVPRLLEGQLSYRTVLEEQADLGRMWDEVVSLVVSAMMEGKEYSAGFEEQAHLWLEDPGEFLQRFLALGSAPGPEGPEMWPEEPPPHGIPSLQLFQQEIDTCEALCEEVSGFADIEVFGGWLQSDCRPFKQALLGAIERRSLVLRQHLVSHVTTSLQELKDFIQEVNAGLSKPLEEGDYDGLVEVMGHLMRVRGRQAVTDSMFEPLKETVALLGTYGEKMPEEIHLQLHDLPEHWESTKKLCLRVKQSTAPLQAREVNSIHRMCRQFEVQQRVFRERFREKAPFSYTDPDPYTSLDKWQRSITAMESDVTALSKSARLFGVSVPEYRQLGACHREVRLLKELWNMIVLVNTSIGTWKTTKWKDIDVEQMEADCKRFAKDIQSLDKEMRSWDAFTGLENSVRNVMTSLRAVSELRNPAIRHRHWQKLMQTTKVKFTMSEDTTLAELLRMNLHEFEEEVHGIVDKALKELGVEKVLSTLAATWATMRFEYEPHARTGVLLLRSDEVLLETLEDHQVQLQNLLASKHLASFLEAVSGWQQKLSTADAVTSLWFEVQRTWSQLESIFLGCEDIRSQLPADSEHFEAIDGDFRELMAKAATTPNVIEATTKPGLCGRLEALRKSLALCEKALAEHLETKRLAFPRFYFVSSADLLDIVSHGNEPVEVFRHLPKLFDSLARLKFRMSPDKTPLKVGVGMFSRDEEYVPLDADCDLSGQVEVWLNRVLARMRSTLRRLIPEAAAAYEEKPREQWVLDYPAQVALTCSQIWWATEVGIAFSRLEEGYEHAMRDYSQKQVARLNALIALLRGNLTAGDRMKIMTICTVDVHARDVVAKMILTKVESAQAFTWQCQLRHRWDEARRHCYANICDAQLWYSYEYLGNTPRLVITPLTERCYITLTQSLHLFMGGAPAGPAGTGKTETTKDLGRAVGMMVYVFNCSEQMDYKSCGSVYKGLALTGAWGCFDEFNRIATEVLSVIAVQVKCIQDAVRAKKRRFQFLGETIALVPSVGLFVTVNPGCAGRTELPENLKALFRPCAMVVPDFELICEVMLVAEGFVGAKLLARKFVRLYALCKELLSKQDHYDWGLRAIKSVLVVVGSLKRGDPDCAEDQVLMRALRDFNIPKIMTDDLPVFLGLIGDLFPALDVPRKRDLDFEEMVTQSVLELGLQAEESFVLKVVQLEELLRVRHCVFVIGSAGCGKSQVLRSLQRTYQRMKRTPVAVDLDPKAVTRDELFGVTHPTTREWKDGLLSSTMRDLANIPHEGPKWLVLDGDVDPSWIESLNTVMDDNKVLTLANNERIPLSPTMRLLFEVSHLRTATPATVSRAGILYVNPTDLGWNLIVSSWIETRTALAEKANLSILFDKYLPACLEKLKAGFKQITPVPEVTVTQTLLYLLECLLTPHTIPPDSPRELYELYFVFACAWAFGGAMSQDQLLDYRLEFSKWWVSEFKTIKFPPQGTIFDYYIDPETKKFTLWAEKVPKFELDPQIPLQASVVHTAETVRLRYFLDLLLERRRPVMLVGNAGTGKSVLMRDKLDALDAEEFLVQAVPFNFYTTSAMLQAVLEKPLEKKWGRNYAPPRTKRLIYFIDDMNMPEVDKYGTVAPHALLRQHMDHGHWYDRDKLTPKNVHNCQYVACMNPAAGSFTIDARLQRHFCVFAVGFPGAEALLTVFGTVLAQHLARHSVPPALRNLQPTLVAAALALHQKVASTFLPTAIKFHYLFNLRDLANTFQGLLFSTAECLRGPVDLVRLWLHEAERVYGDKLADGRDRAAFGNMLADTCRRFFEDLSQDLLFAQPNVYCHFAQGLGEHKYLPVPSWAALHKLLAEALDGYNKANAAMSLVLFEDAVSHVCRISRILESPQGNALLVGVAGSGKRSLARLAAYISNLAVFQIALRKGYGIPDLKLDLASQHIKAAVEDIPTVFLLTDSQVAEEPFLVLINDFLASGEVPGLFPDNDLGNILQAMRPQAKLLGLQDTRENCWKLFIEKVRRQLKVILCFSPVGSTVRERARKFPAVVNCTAIDWFHEWPEDALVSVSSRFLEETAGIEPEVKVSISQFMSHVHTSVKEMSKTFLATERRFNYTTPKTFLEQIKLYQSLLSKKRGEFTAKTERLEQGLRKLQSMASQVDDLKAKLAAQEAELKQKEEDADKLIHVVGVEVGKVRRAKAVADKEELEVKAINTNVAEKQRACEADLAKAEPALVAAQEALDMLNKNNLTELKSFGSPPQAVVNVMAAVMVLTAPRGEIPRDRSWKAAKVMMGKADAFLDALKRFDKEHIPEACLKAFRPYRSDPGFDPESIVSQSTAAAGLCSWCLNIVRFHEVFCEVEPRRQALEAANAKLAEAQERLTRVKTKVADLNANLAALTAAFERATAEKIQCQQEANATTRVIELANRLMGGLASEKVRWAESVGLFREQEKTLCGDVLLVSAFVSYVGYFPKKYRDELLEKHWIPFLGRLAVPIPITPGLDPLSLLADAADVATWSNQGLPGDRTSLENAAILCTAQRWPLLVDAQLQGVKWVRNKYGEELRTARLGKGRYLDTIEQAVSEGQTLLVEEVGETMEPVLEHLLGRTTTKKGRYVRIGDKEVKYHPRFRLILHTKRSNPHFQPEVQAQCTLINFSVTREGLEDQLLAAVVAKERPDLETLKAKLRKSQNEFRMTRKELEDSLLAQLSAAAGEFLQDTALVENLETTQRTAAEIGEKVREAEATEIQINAARDSYRPVAERASLLYFLLGGLHAINPIYQFSLKAFIGVFERAIERTAPAGDVRQRVLNLAEEITRSVHAYAVRGLFERDKLIFLAQLTFQILALRKELAPAELDFLLRFPSKAGAVSPVDFLQPQAWGGIKVLSEMEEFKNLDSDIEGLAKRWKKLVESAAPEREAFPKEWKHKSALQKLCVLRCLRPDRMSYAIRDFVEEKMGSKFVEGRSVELVQVYEESSPSTPLFFILSPGADPLKDVEALGKKLNFTIDNGRIHNVSLGQGQEPVAERALELAATQGHWVILQNIHLVAPWLDTLEATVERCSQGSHAEYRVFLSAEPAPSPQPHVIPQGLLEDSIKLTSEPPAGMSAHLHKALDLFTQDTLELCSKEAEFKSILFALCYFHAAVTERRKFGAQGWNAPYPFSDSDLTTSVHILRNYLEPNATVPWDDLRYLVGEIIYGGHITDGWDRRLCRTYLSEYIRAETLEGEVALAPGFLIPPSLDYKGYHQYVAEHLPPESPGLYGLHPNADVAFLTLTSDRLFRTLLEMQPKEADAGGGSVASWEEKVQAVLDELVERLPEPFNTAELAARAGDQTPYVVVAFQECERMNALTQAMRGSLRELDSGLKGELTITPDMEELANALFYDRVPQAWARYAYPSLLSLGAWYTDLLLRIRELEAWTTDFALPATVWLAGFSHPQAFLTAVTQSAARKNKWPLDKMCLSVHVTKKTREDVTAPPREGSYVHGLVMEGARWDVPSGAIAEARLKELTHAMPVILVRGIPADHLDTRSVYECPVYKTRLRGPTYVWTFHLKTKEKAEKWVLAAVALLLQN